MRPLRIDAELSRHLIVDGFAQAVSVLIGELRRAKLFPADREGGTMATCERFAHDVWTATVQTYLHSPMRGMALAGNPDVGLGYAHLLAPMSAAGIDRTLQSLRTPLGRLSNEICGLVGRLLLLHSAGAEEAMTVGLQEARVRYLELFRTCARQLEAAGATAEDPLSSARS